MSSLKFITNSTRTEEVLRWKIKFFLPVFNQQFIFEIFYIEFNERLFRLTMLTIINLSIKSDKALKISIIVELEDIVFFLFILKFID